MIEEKEQYLAYVDESGDEGRYNRSPRWFINSAVVVKEKDEPIVRSYEDECKQKIWINNGLTPKPYLHWRELSHSPRLILSRILATKDYCQIAVCLDKRQLRGLEQNLFYTFSARLLLERISWYVDDMGGWLKKNTFSKRGGITNENIQKAVGGYLIEPGCQIRPIFNISDICVKPMTRLIMLRFADNTASALGNTLNEDQYGELKTDYFENLYFNLYKYRGMNRVWKYGLKVFPCRKGKEGFYDFIADYPHTKKWFKKKSKPRASRSHKT